MALSTAPSTTPPTTPPTTPSRTQSTTSSTTPSTDNLSPAVLESMKTEFSKNLSEYCGLPWTLPTGTNIDNTLYDYTMTLKVESSLHSFIIDQASIVTDLFNHEDQRSIQDTLDTADTELLQLIPEWKRYEVARYLMEPQQLEHTLGEGWRNLGSSEVDDIVNQDELISFRRRLDHVLSAFCLLYEDHGYKLPESKPEVRYFTKVWTILLEMLSSGSEWLNFKPGDKRLIASSLSRNKDRNLEVRQASGHKVDGLLLCRKDKTELGAMEAGRKDDGPTGTKALEDAKKLAKILKDMHNTITRSCAKSILKDLRVYGLLISRLRVEFVL
ncbi:hypothetical protein BGX26_009174 [Mortierella sp. AD094]|nr:hypothetical protein BGX26_009174 [Mortierella sp. AD094]